jgi:hypothetical protein
MFISKRNFINFPFIEDVCSLIHKIKSGFCKLHINDVSDNETLANHLVSLLILKAIVVRSIAHFFLFFFLTERNKKQTSLFNIVGPKQSNQSKIIRMEFEEFHNHNQKVSRVRNVEDP